MSEKKYWKLVSAHKHGPVVIAHPSGETGILNHIPIETLIPYRGFQRRLLARYGIVFRHACEDARSLRGAWLDAIEAALVQAETEAATEREERAEWTRKRSADQ